MVHKNFGNYCWPFGCFLLGLVCLGYLAIKLGKLEVLSDSGYTVYADFPTEQWVSAVTPWRSPASK